MPWAASLLFGQDGVILPHYKTAALLRRQDFDHFDDRPYIQTDL